MRSMGAVSVLATAPEKPPGVKAAMRTFENGEKIIKVAEHEEQLCGDEPV